MGIFNFLPNQDHVGHIRVGKRGPKGVGGKGFKLTSNGDYDVENKRLTNVGEPKSKHDATTKHFIEDLILSASGAQRNPFAFLLKDKTKSTVIQSMENLQIENYDKSPYQINKSAFSFFIKSGGNFTSKIRFDVSSLLLLSFIHPQTHTKPQSGFSFQQSIYVKWDRLFKRRFLKLNMLTVT